MNSAIARRASARVPQSAPSISSVSSVAWEDYTEVDDVVLVPLDTAVTTIDFSDTIEVARGSVITDDDGTRQATLLFEQGTQVVMVLPDSSLDTLTSIAVRATEYTVGARGPEAMPAALPSSSAYTYAVELSVDEGLAAGARAVEFSRSRSTWTTSSASAPA